MKTLPDKLTFLDLETTGLSFARDRIIEIGILRVEAGEVVDEFNSLIDPGVRLSPEITRMTGISQKDVDRAPGFSLIRDRVRELLSGSVMVAHNARFDYGFLKSEFGRLDESLSHPHLCTVRLFRQLFPKKKSHGLDSLIETYAIDIKRRHRAYDDAKALWDFYRTVISDVPEKKLIKIMAQLLGRPVVPINMELDQIEGLPEKPGVYVFYDKEAMPLYVGKSINIKERVRSHLSGSLSSSREMKLFTQVSQIESFETSGELSALLLESQMVKKLKPVYNRVLREKRRLVTLFEDEGKDGYRSVRIETLDELDVNNLDKVLGIYRSVKAAKEEVVVKIKEHNLCPRICGIESGNGVCFYYHLGICNGACAKKEESFRYNTRFVEAFGKRFTKWPFDGPIEIVEGRERMVVDKWCVLNGDSSYRFDLDTYKILIRFLREKRGVLYSDA